jgi:GWxTD domain-containing protein
MIARKLLLSLVLLLALPCVALATASVTLPLGRDAAATSLFDRAERRLAQHTIEFRRMAIADLERATELAPDRADIQLTLARAYYQAGFLKESRQRYERTVALAPNDSQARLGLGHAWRRDWLKYLERASLDRAVQHYAEAGRLDSSNVDAWLMMSALEIERGDLPDARAAAEHALHADRARAESMLAAASTRWRQGDVAGSDSLFRAALSRLRRSVRERFEDFAPLETERDTAEFNRLSAAGRAEYARRFWRDHDPDLGTPENEAQLEYWARVAQAYFLYYDPTRREWDERGEVYVRYGPPDFATYNPVGASLYGARRYGTTSISGELAFPINMLVWTYRSLGMEVVLHDRMLSERYELPVSMDTDMDPMPDPAAVLQGDMVVTPGLRGVFPLLPPGAKALHIDSQLATFEGGSGATRLFAGVAAPGGPADTLAADFVVLDSTLTEVARVHRALSPSACEAATLRVADFTTELPPGDYRVGMSVRGGGRRGATRGVLHVERPDTTLAMSDVMVTCGVPVVPEGTVRLDANPAGNVRSGEPLVAYFEVYHLKQGPGGEGRFEYETSVRSARPDTRNWIQRWLAPRNEGQNLGVTRQDAVLGGVRRQFVSMSVKALPPGRYRLDVTVRDVLTGDEQHKFAEFTREPDAR